MSGAAHAATAASPDGASLPTPTDDPTPPSAAAAAAGDGDAKRERWGLHHNSSNDRISRGSNSTGSLRSDVDENPSSNPSLKRSGSSLLSRLGRMRKEPPSAIAVPSGVAAKLAHYRNKRKELDNELTLSNMLSVTAVQRDMSLVTVRERGNERERSETGGTTTATASDAGNSNRRSSRRSRDRDSRLGRDAAAAPPPPPAVRRSPRRGWTRRPSRSASRTRARATLSARTRTAAASSR